jgi:hypothetical protein|tara:strand:- start:552 stop:773 length:222 start_codon:yes stop_codon:yes gene_type:complete
MRILRDILTRYLYVERPRGYLGAVGELNLLAFKLEQDEGIEWLREETPDPERVLPIVGVCSRVEKEAVGKRRR